MKKFFFYLYLTSNFIFGLSNATEMEEVICIENLSFHELIKLLKEAADKGDEDLQIEIANAIIKSSTPTIRY